MWPDLNRYYKSQNLVYLPVILHIYEIVELLLSIKDKRKKTKS